MATSTRRGTGRRSFGTGPSSRLLDTGSAREETQSPVLRDRPFIEASSRRHCRTAPRCGRRSFGTGPSSRRPTHRPHRHPRTVAGPSGPALHRGTVCMTSATTRPSSRRSFGTGPSSRRHHQPRHIRAGPVAGPSGPALHRGNLAVCPHGSVFEVAGPSGPALHRGLQTIVEDVGPYGRRSFGTGPSSRRGPRAVGACPPAGGRRSFGTGPSSRPADQLSKNVNPDVAGPSGPALHRGEGWRPSDPVPDHRRRSFGTGPSSRHAEPCAGFDGDLRSPVLRDRPFIEADGLGVYRCEHHGRRSFGTGPSSRP